MDYFQSTWEVAVQKFRKGQTELFINFSLAGSTYFLFMSLGSIIFAKRKWSHSHPKWIKQFWDKTQFSYIFHIKDTFLYGKKMVQEH